MPINKSSTALSAIYKGSSTVTKAYKGTAQIYPNTVPDYNIDYLVIAGGGAGGNGRGGAAGAGAYTGVSSFTLTGGNTYTVTIDPYCRAMRGMLMTLLSSTSVDSSVIIA